MVLQIGNGMRSRFLLLVGLIIALCIAGCGQPQPQRPGAKSMVNPSTSKPKEEDSVDAKLQAAKVLMRDEKGRPLWAARFSEGTGSKDYAKSVGIFHNVSASLYKDGKVASTLVAPLVEADSRSKEFRASGGIKIVSNSDGATATCQRIVWKSKENKVYGTGNVKMTRQNMTVIGNSFVSDTSLKSAKFVGQTSISVH